MPEIDVAVLPGALGGGSYAQAVVVDVLRATTTMVSMLEAGASLIVPVAELDQARRIGSGCPGALLAGERGGVAPPGFDLGNSPLPGGLVGVRGRSVVMSTTNGTRAVRDARGAARSVLAMSLTNLDAVMRRLVDHASDAVVVCAGTDGGRSLEDEFTAGFLAARLREHGWALSGGAVRALVAYEELIDDARSVEGAVFLSAHARRLIEMGFEADVAFCSRVGTSGIVPVLVEPAVGAGPDEFARFVAS